MSEDRYISWAFPFTDEEYTQAHSGIVSPSDLARELAALKASLGGTIMDGTLLLLATVSDETAKRVIEYRPSLAEAVAFARKDPEGFKDAIRRAKLED